MLKNSINAAISIQAGNNDFLISHFVCVHKTNDANNCHSIYIDLAWSQIIFQHSHLFKGCETSINESMLLIIIKNAIYMQLIARSSNKPNDKLIHTNFSIASIYGKDKCTF